MTLATMTLMVFTLTGALFYLPVIMSDSGPTDPVCPNSPPVRITVLDIPPFVEPSASGKIEGVLGKFFYQIAKKCFLEKCNLTEDSFNATVFNSTRSFLKSIQDGNADIAFPISRPLKMWLSGDSYTGPVIDIEGFMKSPGYSLIMDVNIVNRKANDIVMTTLMENIWPIIVFTLLLAGISGICVWILETYFNEEEFPRSFTRGSYEGFWWAFVSMTTVGYGDKTPKFIFGRCFGVFWILTGLVVIAIFTATATSALSITASDLAVLEGSTIGVLCNTSAELEAKQRGANVTALPSVARLFNDLKSEKIDGVFMDKYKAAWYLHEIDEPRSLKVFKSFAVDVDYDLVIRPSQFLPKMGEDSCFKQQVKRLDIDHLLLEYLKPIVAYHQDSDSQSIFSGNSITTQHYLLIILGVFLGLVLLGTVAELAYKKLWKATKKVQNGEDGLELKEVRVLSIPVRSNFKDIEDKLGQLVREVSKLQEQLTIVSSQANGSTLTQNTTHM